MRDETHIGEAPQTDREDRSQRIRQMEQQVTQEVNDRDYRSVSLPCLPFTGLIEHWR